MLKSFAGGRLFGGTWGQGVPGVLALHGWRRTHLDFAPVFEGQADGAPGSDHPLTALGPDLAGFGATPPPPEKDDADFEIRYAEKFLRERNKEDRKSRALCAVLLLALAIDIAVHSRDAYRNHVWVDLGSHLNHAVLYPPIVGALLAVLLICVSMYLLAPLFRRKKL